MDFFYLRASFSLCLILGGIFWGTLSWGQTLEEQRLRSRQKLNYLNDMTFDTNPQPMDSVDNYSGVTYTLGIKYVPAQHKRTNIWVLGRLSKRFNEEETFGLLDTILRAEQGFDPVLGWAPRLRVDATLPTNEFVHEQSSFLGALSSQLRLGRSLSPSLYMLWLNSLRWNFHEYRVSEIGTANIQQTLSSFAVFAYTLSQNWQLGLETGWSWARTYEGMIRNNYLLGGFASYVVSAEWSVTAGLSTMASPMTADGQSSNIKVFDDRYTTAYLSFTYFK